MIVVVRRLVLFAAFLAGSLWLTNNPGAEPLPIWRAVGEHVVRAALAISFALFLDACIRTFFWNGYLTKVIGAKVPRLLPLTVSGIIYVSTLFNLLKYDYGVSLGGAIAASGFVAVILGFALRSVILDLFTGLAVSVDRSYVVGDWVTITSRDLAEPVLGQIEDIDWRTTRLRREDGTTLVMPNSLGGIFSITNHSQPVAPKRLEVKVMLPHETPRDRVEQLLLGATLSAVEAEGYSNKPKPVVLMTDINKDGVEYAIRFYADIHAVRPSTAMSHIRMTAHDAILRNGLVFPARKLDVRKDLGVDQGVADAATATASALRATPLFAGTLTEAEIKSLADNARRRQFAAKEEWIVQGEPGDSLFVILSGAASVLYANGAPTPQKLAVLTTGAVVGEMSLLTGKPRSASVVAVTEIDVAEIRKVDLAPLLKARPEMAEALSWLLTTRAAIQDGHDESLVQSKPEELRPAAQRLLDAIRQFFA